MIYIYIYHYNHDLFIGQLQIVHTKILGYMAKKMAPPKLKPREAQVFMNLGSTLPFTVSAWLGDFCSLGKILCFPSFFFAFLLTYPHPTSLIFFMPLRMSFQSKPPRTSPASIPSFTSLTALRIWGSKPMSLARRSASDDLLILGRSSDWTILHV